MTWLLVVLYFVVGIALFLWFMRILPKIWAGNFGRAPVAPEAYEVVLSFIFLGLLWPVGVIMMGITFGPMYYQYVLKRKRKRVRSIGSILSGYPDES